jgi:hypothetical protein
MPLGYSKVLLSDFPFVLSIRNSTSASNMARSFLWDTFLETEIRYIHLATTREPLRIKCLHWKRNQPNGDQMSFNARFKVTAAIHLQVEY